MKKLLVLAPLSGIFTSYSATIISADSALITGSTYNNHYGQYGTYFPADGKRLDMSTPTTERGNWLPNNFSLFFCQSFGTTASNFDVSGNGKGLCIRINGSGAAGIS